MPRPSYLKAKACKSYIITYNISVLIDLGLTLVGIFLRPYFQNPLNIARVDFLI